MASKSKRKRNYAKEYLIRIARGLAAGKSLSQARGHARAADLPSTAGPQPFKRSEPLEDALKLIKKGVSQKEAAKQAGVSAETLRRFQKLNTTSQRVGRRWVIVDKRPRRASMHANPIRLSNCAHWKPIARRRISALGKASRLNGAEQAVDQFTTIGIQSSSGLRHSIWQAIAMRRTRSMRC